MLVIYFLILGCNKLNFKTKSFEKMIEAIEKKDNKNLNMYIENDIYLLRGYNSQGETPLMIAAKLNNLDAIELILEKELDSLDEYLQVFIYADYSFDKKYHFIENQAEYTLEKTAILYAIENDHLEAVELLIKKGAKLEKEAILFTVFNNRLEMTKLLLENGIDINLDYNYTLSSCSSDSEDEHHSGMNNRRNLLAVAASQGNIEIMKLLIAKGANLNPIKEEIEILTRDEEIIILGLVDNPLLLACRKLKLNAVKLLIDNGACVTDFDLIFNEFINSYYDIQEPDEVDNVIAEIIRLTDYFSSKFSNINLDKELNTFLIKIALVQVYNFKLYKIFEFLLSKGADIDTESSEGSVLSSLIHCHYRDITLLDKIKFFISKGMDINKKISLRYGSNDYVLENIITNRTLLDIASFQYNFMYEVVNLYNFKYSASDVRFSYHFKNIYLNIRDLDIIFDLVKEIINNKKYDFRDSTIFLKNILLDENHLSDYPYCPINEYKNNRDKLTKLMIDRMKENYLNIENKSIKDFELAKNQLHSPNKFNYNNELKKEYVQLLKIIIKFLVKFSNNSENKNYSNLLDHLINLDEDMFIEVANHFDNFTKKG